MTGSSLTLRVCKHREHYRKKRQSEVRTDIPQCFVSPRDMFRLVYKRELSMPLLSTPSSSPPVTPSSISSVMPICSSCRDTFYRSRCLLQRLFRKIEHMGTEQRFSLFFEPGFTSCRRPSIQGSSFFCCVIGVNDYRNTIQFCNFMNMLCTWNAPFLQPLFHCRFSMIFRHRIRSHHSKLNDNGWIHQLCRFKHTIHESVPTTFDSRYGKLVGFAIRKSPAHHSCDYTRSNFFQYFFWHIPF